jgi:hypothetical protein
VIRAAFARLVSLWDEYWFRPGPTFDLAVVRIIVVGFHFGFMLGWMPVRGEFFDLAALPDWYYQPIGPFAAVAKLTAEPWRPSLGWISAWYWIVVAAAPFAFVGLFTRTALVLVAAGSVLTRAYAWSFGEVHHPEAVMMFALCALALSPSGAALSVDAWRRRRRTEPRARLLDELSIGGGVRADATWGIRLLQWLFALIYFSAGYHKLARGGLEWMNGETLRFYLIEDGLRWGGLALAFAELPTFVLQFLSAWTIWLEATFFLAVLFPSLVWIYVPMGIALHTGIYVTMRAPFFEYIAIYSVFVPWSRLLKARRP